MAAAVEQVAKSQGFYWYSTSIPVADGLRTCAQILYEAQSGTDSYLVSRDPNYGFGSGIAAGSIGTGVGAMAVDSRTGILYGVSASGSGPSSTNPQLLRIDRKTTIGTVIGPLNLGNNNISDVAFGADGTLFGWSENGDDLITINLTTGEGTIVGDSGISTFVSNGLDPIQISLRRRNTTPPHMMPVPHASPTRHGGHRDLGRRTESDASTVTGSAGGTGAARRDCSMGRMRRIAHIQLPSNSRVLTASSAYAADTLAAPTWDTDPDLGVGTPIRGAHISEVRAALLPLE